MNDELRRIFELPPEVQKNYNNFFESIGDERKREEELRLAEIERKQNEWRENMLAKAEEEGKRNGNAMRRVLEKFSQGMTEGVQDIACKLRTLLGKSYPYPEKTYKTAAEYTVGLLEERGFFTGSPEEIEQKKDQVADAAMRIVDICSQVGFAISEFVNALSCLCGAASTASTALSEFCNKMEDERAEERQHNIEWEREWHTAGQGIRRTAPIHPRFLRWQVPRRIPYE